MTSVVVNLASRVMAGVSYCHGLTPAATRKEINYVPTGTVTAMYIA